MRRGLVFWLLLATSCGDERTCAWGVDELLRESDASVEMREDCGSFHYSEDALATGYQCFEAAVDAGRPAELTVNFCIDCAMPSTFVSTSSGELLRVEMEDDQFGDGSRTATVERCDRISTDSRALPQCVNPTQLYLCQDPRR
jgi:hypothetical protein